MTAQDVYTRMQYSRKHFSPVHRALYLGILGLRYLARAIPVGSSGRERSAAARRALRMLFRLDAPPFGEPPRQSVAPRPVADTPAPLRRISSGS